MDVLTRIRELQGSPIVPTRDDSFGPHGNLGLGDLVAKDGYVTFELLVPTEKNDVWDYIWSSEKKKGTTDKVQLFQSGERVPGSRITSITREGEMPFCDVKGPDRYRLSFEVPESAIRPDARLQLRFFWDGNMTFNTPT